jgi:hypothetical protein
MSSAHHRNATHRDRLIPLRAAFSAAWPLTNSRGHLVEVLHLSSAISGSYCRATPTEAFLGASPSGRPGDSGLRFAAVGVPTLPPLRPPGANRHRISVPAFLTASATMLEYAATDRPGHADRVGKGRRSGEPRVGG